MSCGGGIKKKQKRNGEVDRRGIARWQKLQRGLEPVAEWSVRQDDTIAASETGPSRNQPSLSPNCWVLVKQQKKAGSITRHGSPEPLTGGGGASSDDSGESGCLRVAV